MLSEKGRGVTARSLFTNNTPRVENIRFLEAKKSEFHGRGPAVGN